MLKRLDEDGKITLASQVRIVLQNFGFNYAWLAQEIGNPEYFLQLFISRVVEVCIQTWHININNEKSLLIMFISKKCENQKDTLIFYQKDI